MIVTDDQRDDTMALMPETRRWLAGQGVEYRNGVATTPLCCPARGSIFSGQYVHNHGVKQLWDHQNLDHRHTVQAQLKRTGYRTAITGKYFGSWDYCNDDPPFFDRFAIFSNGYEDAAFRVDEETGQNPVALQICAGGDGHGTTAPYSTTFIEEKALEFLDWFESSGDRDPWLLFVTPYAPHWPYTPETRYADAPVPEWRKNPAVDEADVSDKPLHVRQRGVVASQRKEADHDNYLRTLLSVDDLVANLRTRLLRLGELENTLVLFTSDHGYLWAEHRLIEKREAYRWSIEVPLFAAWSRCSSKDEERGCPGTLRAGSTEREIGANIDLAPTIYEATGVAPEYVVDGKSLFGGTKRRRILVEYWTDGPVTGVAVGDDLPLVPTYAAFWSPRFLYRELYYGETAYTPGLGLGATDAEYYDYRTDPYELVNLLGDADPSTPSRDLGTLSQELEAARTCSGLECP